MQLASSTGGSTGHLLAGSAAGNALTSLGLASGNQVALSADNKSEDPMFYDDTLETRA